MKDKRGVQRGRCLKCLECEYYDLPPQGNDCGYCGCPPVQHLQTPVTQLVQSSGLEGQKFDQLSEKRKLALGWLPYPKAAKSRFNNEILPAFYEASYPVPDDKRFKTDFIMERNRAFEIKEKIEKHESKLSFIRGDNPAAGGRFLKAQFSIKSKHDLVTCETNLEKLNIILAALNKEKQMVQEDDNSLFRSDGLRLKTGQVSKHDYNSKALGKISSLISCAESDRGRLEAALQRLKTFFSSEENHLSRAKRMKKEAKRKNEKRKALRRERQEAILIEAVFGGVSDAGVQQVYVGAVAALNYQQGTHLYTLLKRLQITAEAHDQILTNLSGPGKQGYRAAHLNYHVACRGECESEDCAFYERAAQLFRSLGGQTHHNLYAPAATGLPQLNMAELDMEVFQQAESSPELIHLLSVGCFAEEVEGLMKTL
ncbi:unnamed protein product [Merluccius merluccius]